MWIDTYRCDNNFHEINRDSDGEWQCVHSDGSKCERAEYNVADLIDSER